MPDYGGGSNYRDVSGISGGSGYTTSSQASSGGSKAAQKRKKAAIQARQRAEKALADQKKIDAAKAKAPIRTTAVVSNQEQQRYAAEAAKARQALQDLGGMTGNVPISSINQSSASRPSTAYDSSSQQTSKIITGEHSNKNAFEKARDDFLMDIGAKDKDADYYYRLSDRTKAASDRAKDATQITTDGPSTRLGTNTTTTGGDDTTTTGGDDTTTTTLPPIGTFPLPPQFPQYPGYGGGMTGGIGAFGYSPALMQFESQQGAGQVPYYMAAARNQFNPNMSPAFQYAAQNYDILGGSQRIAPRPIEMMSAAERAQIAGIGSNFNTPNYNSPYAQSPPQSEFDFFKNMVSGGMPTQVPTSSFGKGNRGRMTDGNARGLASLLASGAGGMFG